MTIRHLCGLLSSDTWNVNCIFSWFLNETSQLSLILMQVTTCSSRFFKSKHDNHVWYWLFNLTISIIRTWNRSVKMIPTATAVSGCVQTTNFWSPVTIKRPLSVAVLVWSFVISSQDRHEAAFHYGYCHWRIITARQPLLESILFGGQKSLYCCDRSPYTTNFPNHLKWSYKLGATARYASRDNEPVNLLS